MSWKYVIVQAGNTEIPVIFPERLVHALVVDTIKDYFVAEARILAGGLVSEKAFDELRAGITAVSAGSLNMIVTHAGGHSETLNIVSRPEDKDAINTHPYTGGQL